ncbi:MAG: YgeY family selenium metabolism-linked hydrolase [Candidatus Heimdallarchaeota archaeon]
MNEKISKATNAIQSELTVFTRDIIAIPSFSDEILVINRIKEEMKEIGFQGITYDNMGNLRGSLGSGPGLLVIDAHADTVEVGNESGWKHDPFVGKLEQGIIYGRGACDQKGGLAAALYTGKVLLDLGIPENLTYMVVVSVKEEIYEGLNWQFLVKEERIAPDAVILSEPSNLDIIIGQRGRADVKVRTFGISSHGATPDNGVNAIYKIAPIILEIKELHEKLVSDPIFGKASITVTKIDSTAPAINAVADGATIHLDRRLNRDETDKTVLTEIRALPSVKLSDAEVFIPEYEYTSPNGLSYPIRAYYPTWKLEADHPLVQSAIKAYKNQFSKEPRLGYWPFSTNGAATKGLFDIPTIGFGPGNPKYAHTTDDQVPVDHLLRAVEYYSAFTMSWKNGERTIHENSA